MAIEFLEHTADTAVRIGAATPEEFIAEAARAFYAVLLAPESMERIDGGEEVAVDLQGLDGEVVLVDFLNELLYRFDAFRLLLPEVRVEEVHLEAGRASLRALLRGGRFDPSRHLLRTEVKAATYHGLEIRRRDGWIEAEVVFDL